MIHYELYHDESKVNGYWHGMLLIPKDKKKLILQYLELARKNVGYKYPLGIKNVKKRNRVFKTAYAWVQIGVCALRSRAKFVTYPIYLGKEERGNCCYDRMPDDFIGAKFILFREREAHQDMLGYPDHSSKVETTFRMGLKGGLHFLGKEQE